MDYDNITQYDGAAKVPGEIRNIKDIVFFGMTARQIIFLAIGLVLAGGSAYLIYQRVDISNSNYLFISFALGCPFFAFGFIRPNNLNLEDWLTIWRSNRLKSKPIRTISAVNTYERAVNAGISYMKKGGDDEEEGKKKKKGITGLLSGKKKKKKKKKKAKKEKQPKMTKEEKAKARAEAKSRPIYKMYL